jgi:hypothetical protein
MSILAPFGLTPEHFARIDQMKTDPSSFEFKNQFDYAKASGKDLVDRSMPGFGIPSMMGQVLATPFYDTLQGIQESKKPYKDDFTQYSGITDYGEMPVGPSLSEVAKGIKDQKIGTMMAGRFMGGLESLFDTGKNYASKISDAIISPAYAPELDDIESIIEARKNREELNRIGSLALDDAGLNTAAMVDEFSQTSKPRFDLTNFLTNVKDKGIDMLGSGKELAFRGIGNLIAGPVGGFIGGAIGKMKTTPEQRLLKDFYEKETGLDSIGRIQGGIMQGYNPVSMFGPQGLTSAIDKRLATILQTEKKKKAKGLELSKKLIERRKQLEELKRKEEQARVDATRRMAQENRAAGTGGYQAGYDRDFMGGSGTAKDMGSF